MTEPATVTGLVDRLYSSSAELTFIPDSVHRREYFKTLSDKSKKPLIEAALLSQGMTTTMTQAELVRTAANMTGRTAADLINEGIDFACQRAITNAASGANGQTCKGAADDRIIKAISNLRAEVADGTYKVRIKRGQAQAIIPLTAIAGMARTGTVTVQSFMDRHPDYQALLDVTSLL
jgi:hypothetical protein